LINCSPRHTPKIGLPACSKASTSARSYVHHDPVEPFRVVRQLGVAARRLAGGAGHHHDHRAGRHQPVRDGLLDVLQGLVGEQGPRRIGVLEAGGKADLEAAGDGLLHVETLAKR
jgi:hypothetical protein